MEYLKYIIVPGILVAGVCWSIWRRKLTVRGAITGAVLGWLLFAGGGYAGLAMMTVFFVAGTAATRWKKEEKLAYKPAEGLEEARTAGQVLANAGVAGLAALGMLLQEGHASLLAIMMAASLSAAAADTLSSELGMVYGRRCYNIMTLQRDKKGLDGVVSLEGLLIGVAGSALIAGVYAIGYGQYHPGTLIVIVVSGTVGNLADSVLGATLERRHILSNDAVNFFNTLTAALVAGMLAV